MKKFLFGLSLLGLIISFVPTNLQATCSGPFIDSSIPPFICTNSSEDANVLFVLDYSGSMLWSAYNPRSDGKSWCYDSDGCGWTYKGTEEGYFQPDRVYRFQCKNPGCTADNNANDNPEKQLWYGYWEDPDSIQNDPVEDCPKYYGDVRNNKKYKGSCLNFIYMSRMDLVRWAITGGKPASCGQSYCWYNDDGCTTGHQFPSYCDISYYPDNNSSISCDDDGCILQAGALYSSLDYKKTKVKVPWSRLRQAFVFKLKDKNPRPRVGAMLYSGAGVRLDKVYIGDFKDNGNIDNTHPYKNLATLINYNTPEGSTPTGPALWDAYNYFKQITPEYGGFVPQSSDDTKWKNPLYKCVDINNNGQCDSNEYQDNTNAHNYVILMTDGQWNSPSCYISNGYEDSSADPVVPAYWLHMGFTNQKTNTFAKVEKVFSIGLWLGGTGETSLKNVAMYGSFDDSNNRTLPGGVTPGNNFYNNDGFPWKRCYMDDCGRGRGSACLDVPDPSHPDWDNSTNNSTANNSPPDGLPDTFYNAKDGSQIVDALEGVLQNIKTPIAAAGAVATVTQQVSGGDIVVRGAFTVHEPNDSSTYTWRGHLEVYWPYDGCSNQTSQDACLSVPGCTWNNNTNTCGGDKIYSFELPENSGKFCKDAGFVGGHCWDAGYNLKSQTSRNIFTFIQGQQKDFNLANTQAYLNISFDFNNDGQIDSNDAQKLINWVKGTINGDGSSMRSRPGDWILGDIVYSSPVVVGQPSLASVPKSVASDSCTCDCYDNSHNIVESCAKECFYCYREKYKHRKKMIYVGANDGMLHAFIVGEWNGTGYTYQNGVDADGDGYKIGEELWAYIPSNLLSALQCLAAPSYGTSDTECKHRSMVDLSPQAWDVYIDHDGDGEKEWRTVLIGGERGGGDTYFAVDVTDPTNPQILWEYPALRNLAFYDVNTNKMYLPYIQNTTYAGLKNTPNSWSIPYVGQLKIPDNVCLNISPTLSPTDDVASFNLTPGCYSQSQGSTWFTFIGGGVTIFLDNGTAIPSLGNQLAGLYPNLMVIDIQTGQNIFQYTWPLIEANLGITSVPVNSADKLVPYTLASPLALDIWNSQGKLVQDGFIDHLYFGDLNGNFYGIIFQPTNSSLAFSANLWKTKRIIDFVSSNAYRGIYQPITVPPVASLDKDFNLRLYFGTGKFNNVDKIPDDNEEKASMSFYSLTDTTDIPTTSFPTTCSLTGPTPPFDVNCILPTNSITIHNCNNFDSNCTWLTLDNATLNSHPDCCQKPCSANSCFSCVLDFTEQGERVINQALVAGNLVFVTTYVTNEEHPCPGISYLYVYDYMCRPLHTNPLHNSDLSNIEYKNADNSWSNSFISDQTKVVRVKLGPGAPSKPILDSAGEHVLVQTSDAKIHKVKVTLPQKPIYIQGWKEEN